MPSTYSYSIMHELMEDPSSRTPWSPLVEPEMSNLALVSFQDLEHAPHAYNQTDLAYSMIRVRVWDPSCHQPYMLLLHPVTQNIMWPIVLLWILTYDSTTHMLANMDHGVMLTFAAIKFKHWSSGNCPRIQIQEHNQYFNCAPLILYNLFYGNSKPKGVVIDSLLQQS